MIKKTKQSEYDEIMKELEGMNAIKNLKYLRTKEKEAEEEKRY